MKKLLTILLALLVLCGCTKAPETTNEEVKADVTTGTYQVFNSLGVKVTELYLYETGTADKGENYAGEKGLGVGKNITLTYDGTEETVLTLEYVDEKGGTGKFETLHIEEAPMNLLAEDARTGATIVGWEKPEGDGIYTVYNVTGGTVTDLYIYEVGKDKGENLAGKGLADGKSVEVKTHGTLDSVWMVEFKADNGEEGTFETLHIEEAPISLLAADARTGATAISFTEPK